MFTGLVEKVGTVSSFRLLDGSQSGGSGCALEINNVGSILEDASLGDSICINGVCLTITELDDARTKAKFGIAPETLRKTNLGSLNAGDPINLERALAAGQRFGGHFVQGHVDTTVTIHSIKADPPNSIIYEFLVPPPHPLTDNVDFINYIVPKGYVCLDGTSLTVIDVNTAARTFSIMLIKYTQEKVIMTGKKVGDKVNLEVDQMGKYVENVVKGMLFGGQTSSSNVPFQTAFRSLVEEIVKEKLPNKL